LDFSGFELHFNTKQRYGRPAGTWIGAFAEAEVANSPMIFDLVLTLSIYLRHNCWFWIVTPSKKIEELKLVN
jgi:hypothetical protein